jgi:hypothetical protein
VDARAARAAATAPRAHVHRRHLLRPRVPARLPGGYYAIDTGDGTGQFGKGIFKWAIHILFLIAAVTYLARRGERFYWQTIGAFTAGLTLNAAYGVLQLVAAQGGRNLDQTVLSPLTGGASSINIYGAVEGKSVYRPNALTGDPNHLGIMLIIPLLALLPVYLRLPRGHKLRRQLAVVLAFLLIVELATLSRSGLLGLAVGVLILAVPYRRKLLSGDLLVPLAAALGLIAIVVLSRLHFFETVIRSRFQTRAAPRTSTCTASSPRCFPTTRCSGSASTTSPCTTRP